jgi:hypothetical protein
MDFINLYEQGTVRLKHLWEHVLPRVRNLMEKKFFVLKDISDTTLLATNVMLKTECNDFLLTKI